MDPPATIVTYFNLVAASHTIGSAYQRWYLAIPEECAECVGSWLLPELPPRNFCWLLVVNMTEGSHREKFLIRTKLNILANRLRQRGNSRLLIEVYCKRI